MWSCHSQARSSPLPKSSTPDTIATFDTGIIPFDPDRAHVPLVLGFGEVEEITSLETLAALSWTVPWDGWIADLTLKVEGVCAEETTGTYRFIFEIVRLKETSTQVEMTGFRCKPQLVLAGEEVGWVTLMTSRTQEVAKGDRLCLVVKLPPGLPESLLFLRFSGGISYTSAM